MTAQFRKFLLRWQKDCDLRLISIWNHCKHFIDLFEENRYLMVKNLLSS